MKLQKFQEDLDIETAAKTTAEGLDLVKEKLKEYINSRIFYTIKEMQFVKWQITRGQKNLHPYFDLLYRATVDGDSEQTFDTLCRGKYPQIIPFRASISSLWASFGAQMGRIHPLYAAHNSAVRPPRMHMTRFAHPNSMKNRFMFLAIPRYAVLQYPNCRLTIRKGCSTLQRMDDFRCSIHLSQQIPLNVSGVVFS